MGRNAFELVYADPNTWSGPDENPLFDEDDELVFMARHVGQKQEKGARFPLNTMKDQMVEVKILDPNYANVTLGYVYFFMIKDIDLDQEVEDLVSYKFNLTLTWPDPNDTLADSYKKWYKFRCSRYVFFPHECSNDEIMNPEDSWFKSAHYERHFAENWSVNVYWYIVSNP